MRSFNFWVEFAAVSFVLSISLGIAFCILGMALCIVAGGIVGLI